MDDEDGGRPAVTITIRNAPRRIVVLLDDETADVPPPNPDADAGMSFDAAEAPATVEVTRSVSAPATLMMVLIDGRPVTFVNGDVGSADVAPGSSHHVVAVLNGGQGGTGTVTIAHAGRELRVLDIEIESNSGQSFAEGRFVV